MDGVEDQAIREAPSLSSPSSAVVARDPTPSDDATTAAFAAALAAVCPYALEHAAAATHDAAATSSTTALEDPDSMVGVEAATPARTLPAAAASPTPPAPAVAPIGEGDEMASSPPPSPPPPSVPPPPESDEPSPTPLLPAREEELAELVMTSQQVRLGSVLGWARLLVYVKSEMSEGCMPMEGSREAEVMTDLLQFVVAQLPGHAWAQRVMYHTMASVAGSQLLLKANMMRVLCGALQQGGAEQQVDCLYLYCCTLHCSQTRNWFAHESIACGVVPFLLSFLERDQDPAHDPALLRAGLLALNWFAGSDVGSAHMVPKLERLLACYRRCDDRMEHKVSLCLTLANLPAFLEHERGALQDLVDAGIGGVLIPVMLSGDVRSGSIGALMGLATLAPLSEPIQMALASLSDGVYTSMATCLRFALAGRPQDNILWSPWQPAQTICNLIALDGRNAARFVEHGVLPLLEELLLSAGAGDNKQSEPDRDEAFGVRAVYELGRAGVAFGEHRRALLPAVARISRSGRSRMSRWYARICVEQLSSGSGSVPSVLTLQESVRSALRRNFGADEPSFRAHVGAAANLPVQLRSFLLYEVPPQLRHWRIRHPAHYASFADAQEEERRFLEDIELAL